MPLLKDADILEILTPARCWRSTETPLAEAIRRGMGDREFLEPREAQSPATGKQHWTLSLAKVPQDVQTDQAVRPVMGDFSAMSWLRQASTANGYSKY